MEEKLYQEGYEKIACIDEVGRGCLAGDVLACAIIMPRDKRIDGITDSKKISEKKREVFYDQILEDALAVGIGRVNSKIIDEINIKEATREAMKRAVENLKDKEGKKIEADYLLVDAEDVYIDIAQDNVIKGDEKSYGIGCASIIAKVYRDRLCQTWDEAYPGYNIKKNKGYGTKEHREKIIELGVSDIHRLSFLKNILK